ncbi:phosphoglycerate dehydrogenase [Pelobacter propionicus]|uniref:D-3-phosphoglycerate dehydrogenase n=1 Tax=Pelobacter propionicus (strain DSM 2379 / NBRC 103807 / OttBd1) TaxID=338966 RepID=A1ALZ5_PELPD|nr:phosphoglycerate dehydrogenase [Pelobacter propionicus]ABK98365.1 D-3-phosphoglycerate dehydrogenase [Pelobacter propionicus DSM 2379]
MYKIQTLNKIARCGLDQLSRDTYEAATEILNPDAILVRSADMHSMELPPSVLAIARAGAGVNNIPIPACTQRGIVVFNTPGANANGVKELVIASLFLSSRNLYEGISWANSLAGTENIPEQIEKGKSRFVGPEIQGKTLGVIGLGAIGVMVANSAANLGMRVLGLDPFISVEAAWKLSHEVIKAPNLDMLLAESDYITIHIPLKDDTKGLFNAERISRMKKGARLLNFSRSGLVDNTAVKTAIAEGQLGGYVIDFPEAELLGVDKVLCIPHLGASTPESEDNCAIMAAEQLREYLERGNIKNSVNYPNCEMAPTGKTRITLLNSNVPKVISRITSTLGEYGLNIDEMLNKNRGEVAYNIIDVSDSVPDELIEKLRQVDGVVAVRLIPDCQ